MRISIFLAAVTGLAALGAAPAAAKIIDKSESGFTTAHSAQVAVPPDDVWKMLRMPQKWWSKEHSWTGDAANLWLDAQAGGCFCEKIPDEGSGLGSVQHARILFAKPSELLRLAGALGPLQGEAAAGVLTIQVKPTPTGSSIRFDYVVGGYMRFKIDEIAPAVDQVIGEQVAGLARALGGALTVSQGKPDTADDDEGAGLDAVAAELARERPQDAPEEDQD